MATNNSNTTNKDKKQQLDNMKYEVANEVGVNLQNGYNGNIASRDAGRIGGNMVKKLVEKAERSMSGR
ncbi:MAG: alpha/beta-type small acid-soluble spore protein [Christensenellales bacterium]